MGRHQHAPRRDDPSGVQFENTEWKASLDDVLHREGPGRVRDLMRLLMDRAQERGVELDERVGTPYINTIPRSRQPPYPGSREIERRIKSLVRWNAMAMVVRANRNHSGIGGHISTYASAATLWEVAFNHFLRAPADGFSGDLVYFQGHASPGVYARAFLEGRLSEEHLRNFRRDLPERGLSSYPHPWLMPGFWQVPSVSMGLAPIMAIYQARFNRYLEHRGLLQASDAKVWCFIGDGEVDEPESLGSISLASREQLDNLILVVNCNLQRLDGPVRGNGKIIQELERVFHGAGWNVIKVIWGDDYDPLLDRDEHGLLLRRMEELVDGDEQKYSVESGAYIREHFFGRYPELLDLVESYSDEQLEKLRRGGHDPDKVYAAYRAAIQHEGRPTVILAKTIKGYGLGEAGEGRNITHKQKELNEDELRRFRSRFGVPIADEDVEEAPFYRPDDDSEEMDYLHARRKELNGYLPQRRMRAEPLDAPDPKLFEEFHQGNKDRAVATTMAFVRLLGKLIKDDDLGPLIIPIIPDEARTFGMDALFRQCGIYAQSGQLYDPVDAEHLLYYKEATDGQILEEGITEAGSMSSFIAAGTAGATHGINSIPFFAFYSMFGFQRIGDLIWAAGDARARGFLMGATAGRTTLNGEGLQHEDGHSHLHAFSVPNLLAYDPAYAYEVAVIIEEGIRRMFVEQEDLIYYITVYNELYPQPAMPEGAGEAILKGMHRVHQAEGDGERPFVRLLGSGTILNQALRARELLDDYGVDADVYSVTSYKCLHDEAQACARWNRLHPGDQQRVPYVTQQLGDPDTPAIAATDYLKALPATIAQWAPGPFVALGTDGYGRSGLRPELRRFFEVDAEHIALAALAVLAENDAFDRRRVAQAIEDFGIDPEIPNPAHR